MEITRTEGTQDGSTLTDGLASIIRNGAMMNPRNEAAAMEKAITELEIVPGLASRAYYSIPYNEGKANQTMVQGLSIRGMNSLTHHYKHVITAGRFSYEDEDYVYVDGMCYDAENNILRMRPQKVSKFWTRRGSNRKEPLDETRLRNASLSGISKAIRNAQNDILPEWIKHAYFESAKQLVIKPKAKGAITQSIQERISNGKIHIMKAYKITGDEMKWHVENMCDSVESEGDMLVHLTGLNNSLSDGVSKSEIARLFGRVSADIAKPKEKKK